MKIILLVALVVAFCSGGLLVIGIIAKDKKLKTLAYCLSVIEFLLAVWWVML